MPTELPLWLERLLDYARVDFAPRHRQPSTVSLVIATAVSIAGSLAADALLVMAGKKLFPTTAHYGHFQFSDYSKLTVIGVLIACVAWPIVTRISSSPRWLFFRQAIAVTLVLLLPDVYIWYQGQPADGVGVLMVMHLAIALVTYNSLVHIARIGEQDYGPHSDQPRRPRHASGRDAGRWDEDQWDDRRVPSGGGQDYWGPWDSRERDMRPVPSGRHDHRAPWDEDQRATRPAPSSWGYPGGSEYPGRWDQDEPDPRLARGGRRRNDAAPWT